MAVTPHSRKRLLARLDMIIFDQRKKLSAKLCSFYVSTETRRGVSCLFNNSVTSSNMTESSGRKFCPRWRQQYGTTWCKWRSYSWVSVRLSWKNVEQRYIAIESSWLDRNIILCIYRKPLFSPRLHRSMKIQLNAFDVVLQERMKFLIFLSVFPFGHATILPHKPIGFTLYYSSILYGIYGCMCTDNSRRHV